MLVHGYNPSDLLLLTIISNPKDLKGSLSKSDNYQGISFVNSICKLFDYVIINLYDKQFKHQTCNLDFKVIILLQYVLQYIWKSLINIR